jgi:hypothetical protein
VRSELKHHSARLGNVEVDLCVETDLLGEFVSGDLIQERLDGQERLAANDIFARHSALEWAVVVDSTCLTIHIPPAKRDVLDIESSKTCCQSLVPRLCEKFSIS